MHAATNCSWLPDAVHDLEALAHLPEPALARRLAPAVARIARMNGGAGAGDSLLRSGSTPFVRLVDAAAVDLGLAGDPRVALVGRSTVMGYLYVRLQDDLVDEEALVDRAAVFAMEAALSVHLDLLARAGVPPSVLVARSRLMTRFAAFAAREVDERHLTEGSEAERVGEKFLGMAVPLVALAALAGREGLDEALGQLVVHLGTALQMINDALNALEDQAAGRTTPLLRWLRADGFFGSTALGELDRAALVTQPAVARALKLAAAESQRAEVLAGGLELLRVAAVAAEVSGLVQRTHERLLGLALGIPA